MKSILHLAYAIDYVCMLRDHLLDQRVDVMF
jgi:hypothetical protein